ncbi:MAG: hypothetical protein DRP66_00910 [Planctomycetota bacterium]|nr:MAG: hypothetical protein DRP66_00910 [Planctomycetota bacterium]
MATEEQVLVVERKAVEQAGLFHGLNFNIAPYLNRLFAPGIPKFIPRPEAEANPDYKQLIPYVIMTCNGKYLTYVRGKRAGETRLTSKRSIGIGGHINPVDHDTPLFGTDFKQIYNTAVQREVAEEVEVKANHTDQIVALLNDDTNEVGRVHLGVVHLWTLDTENVTRKEQMITQLAFMTPAELNKVKETMETWSQLCLQAIHKMTKNKTT